MFLPARAGSRSWKGLRRGASLLHLFAFGSWWLRVHHGDLHIGSGATAPVAPCALRLNTFLALLKPYVTVALRSSTLSTLSAWIFLSPLRWSGCTLKTLTQSSTTSTMSTSAAAASTTLDTGSLRDSYIPVFTGLPQDYKEWKKRIEMYHRKMMLSKRGQESVLNILGSFQGAAWRLFEDMPMSELEKEGAFELILKTLDRHYAYDERVQLPSDFEGYFNLLSRKNGQTLLSFVSEHDAALRKLQAHQIDLPKPVQGWHPLRRANLTREQRQLVTLKAQQLGRDEVIEAMYLLFGQDYKSGGWQAERQQDRWHQRYGKFRAYAAQDEVEGAELSDPGVDDDEAYYQDWVDEEDFDQDEAYFGDEQTVDQDPEADPAILAEEFDEAYATYVDARKRFQDIRLSRGFLPAVALTDGVSGKGSNPTSTTSSPTSSNRKGKGKSTKGGRGTNTVRYPSMKGKCKADPRGRAKGASICLRCGQQGHWAANCPVEDCWRVVGDGVECLGSLCHSGTSSWNPDSAACAVGSVIAANGLMWGTMSSVKESEGDLANSSTLSQPGRCRCWWRWVLTWGFISSCAGSWTKRLTSWSWWSSTGWAWEKWCMAVAYGWSSTASWCVSARSWARWRTASCVSRLSCSFRLATSWSVDAGSRNACFVWARGFRGLPAKENAIRSAGNFAVWSMEGENRCNSGSLWGYTACYEHHGSRCRAWSGVSSRRPWCSSPTRRLACWWTGVHSDGHSPTRLLGSRCWLPDSASCCSQKAEAQHHQPPEGLPRCTVRVTVVKEANGKCKIQTDDGMDHTPPCDRAWCGATIFQINGATRKEMAMYSQGRPMQGARQTAKDYKHQVARKFKKDKNSINERTLTPDERAQFQEAKRKELKSFFDNHVWCLIQWRTQTHLEPWRHGSCWSGVRTQMEVPGRRLVWLWGVTQIQMLCRERWKLQAQRQRGWPAPCCSLWRPTLPGPCGRQMSQRHSCKEGRKADNSGSSCL